MTRRASRPAPIPIALKLAYGTGIPLIALAYQRRYGAGNFLWLSDLCLALTGLAVTTEQPRPASIAAGVLPLELAWNIDLLCRGRLIGLADYMFDRRLPLWLRALSLFHVAVPATLLWLLRRLGYDRGVLPAQIAMVGGAVALSRLLTEPEKNINWAFGPGAALGLRARSPLPAPLYLALETALLSFGMLLPAHLVARKLFREPMS